MPLVPLRAMGDEIMTPERPPEGAAELPDYTGALQRAVMRPSEGAADLRIHRYTTPALDGAHAFGFRDGWNAAMSAERPPHSEGHIECLGCAWELGRGTPERPPEGAAERLLVEALLATYPAGRHGQKCPVWLARYDPRPQVHPLCDCFLRNVTSDTVAHPALRPIGADLEDAPKLREALRSVGDTYEVDGRHEWHDRDCIYRKTWPMGGEDEPWCVKVRALLASKP